MWSDMDIKVVLALIASILTVCITLGGIVWRLAEKVSTLATKLDGHIESTKEWREYMIKIVNGRLK